MAADLHALLVSSGFSPSEAKVYLVSLELGTSTLLEIVRRSGISKTTTFEALESLRNQKFVRTTKQKGRVIYHAADPEHVVEALRTRVAEQAAIIDDVARAMPEFTNIRGGSARPSVVVREGVEAVYAYFEHLDRIKPESMDEITNSDDIYQWINSETLLHARKMYNWIPKTARILRTGKSRNPRKGFEMRFLNKLWGAFHGDITIYGDYVSMITFTIKPTAIIITSKQLAESLRLLFTIAWRASNDEE